MSSVSPTLSATSGKGLHNPAPLRFAPRLRRPRYPNDTGADHFTQNWPTLSQALGRYTERTADAFSQLAYEHVRAGLIRRTDRLRLAAAAENLGIRDFDAQLLIACAIRRWAIDHRTENGGENKLPRLAGKKGLPAWVELSMVLAIAVAIDTVLLWKWLG